MTSDRELLTDEDVAKIFGVSARTIQRRLQRPKAGEVDLNSAEPFKVGGRRFWLKEKLEQVVGLQHKRI